MRTFPNRFPPRRRRKPTRRAEARIFDALAKSSLDGFAYYEWRKSFDDIELDFALWVQDHGRAALQVKGGQHQLANGEWMLLKRDGPILLADSPIDEAWLGALDLHDEIQERIRPPYDPFVVPVLALPDMEPDASIAALAQRKRVNIIWRTADTAKSVADVLRSQRVRAPLPWERIRTEVDVVTDGLIQLADVDAAQNRDHVTGCTRKPYHSPQGVPAPEIKTLRIAVAGVPVIEARAKEIIVRSKFASPRPRAPPSELDRVRTPKQTYFRRTRPSGPLFSCPRTERINSIQEQQQC